MKKLAFILSTTCLFAFASQEFGNRNLVLIGGGDLQPPAVKKFSTLAGGKAGNVFVIPFATSSPQEAFDYVKESITATMGANAPALVLATATPDFLTKLGAATAVFFTGGDQNVLMKALRQEANWIPALKAKYETGAVFAGTSAGTAIMSKTMMTGEGDEKVIDPNKVGTAEGLGLLTGVIVDQHFIIRQRQNRLISVLMRDKECFGFGIDEDNAVYVQNNVTAEVLGPGKVMTFDHCRDRYSFLMEIKSPGDVFTLHY